MSHLTPTSFSETESPPEGGRAAVVAATLARTTGRAKSEPANPSGDRPAIYVACLAAYNSGILHGDWIWADDADDMRGATRAMLARSPEPGAEEWAIHDHAGFEGARIEEYQSFETVAEIAAFIEARGEVGAKVLEHYSQDLDDARRAFEDYRGAFGSLEDYAFGVVEECGPEVPEAFRHYIDWAAMGRDMELNGDVFTVEANTGEHGAREVHVFGGH